MVLTRNKIEISNKLHAKLTSWHIVDQILLNLFHNYPKNNDLEIVDLKVRLVNSLYFTNVRATNKMAKHILDDIENLDKLIEQGEVEAVNRIAHFIVNDKLYHMFSFASKYCHFHNQNKFPIYDSYALAALKSIINKKIKDYDYVTYSKEIFDLARQINSSIKELDQYLWLYGQKLIKDKSKLSWSVKKLFNDNKELVEQLKPESEYVNNA